MFKWLVGAVALISALAGLLIIWNRTAEGQREQGRNEIRLQWEGERVARADAMLEFTRSLDGKLAQRFEVLNAQLGTIDREAQRINIELPRALAADPRYRDPRCQLTDTVRDQINSARALSGPQP